ncbi:MAG TPA: hypothetical protein ENK13_03160, partial [Thermopetrobacter sp.]|nr:hypothetical protein [Thermopetrobacter sp.]
MRRIGPDIETLEDLLAAAYLVEEEAGECLLSLSHQMEVHHNAPMAALFARLSDMRHEAAAAIYAAMQPAWRERIYARDLRWLGESCPGAVDITGAHYRMRPVHGLRLALAAFERIHDFYDEVVHFSESDEVRRHAVELRARVAEDVRAVEEELARTP